MRWACRRANQHQRQATRSAGRLDGRWRVYEYDEVVARDKASVDIFWLKDASLADSDSLPPQGVIAREIVEDLETALEQFRLIAAYWAAARRPAPSDGMRLWVGVTDRSWFELLRARQPEEVNFWQPSAKRRAALLEAGAPFLFKLHAPHNFVVGGGFFVRYSALPARLAWEAFGLDNGVADYPALRRRVAQYRTGPMVGDPEIGCNVLNRPFFWSQDAWIPVPDDWAPNIVQGKGYSTADPAGARLWSAVMERLEPIAVDRVSDSPRFGADYLTHARLGQGAFRVLVTDAYQRRCAITGERTLPVLQAAHIRPYADNGPHLVSNGLLLRSDLHTLFDRGYISVTDELRVLVSGRIREEFANGREYYQHHGKPLAMMPGQQHERPAPDFLRWHNESRYLG